MLTLEEALLMGTNAPKWHQRVIGRLTTRLTLAFEQGVIALEPLPETMLDEGQTSPTPDLILYDNVLAITPVIIEITHTDGVKKDMFKIQQVIDQQFYGIQEGFVYDYKRNQWHKYALGKGVVTDNPSFCEALNLDLATLV